MSDFKTRLTELQKHFLDIAGTISSTVLTEEDSLRYAEFSARLEEINQMAEDFVTPREDGSLPVMDQISLDAFKASYRRSIAACEKVLDENRNDGVSVQMKNLARETKKHLVTDLSAFESISIREEEPLTLNRILELGNTLTVDIGDQKTAGVGQALSSRIPIRVPGAPGGDLNGFFTKSVRVDTEGDKARLFSEQRQKYPELTELLNALEAVEMRKMDKGPFLNVTLARAIERDADKEDLPYPTTKEDMERHARNYYIDALEMYLDEELLNRNAEKKNFALAMSEVAEGLGAIWLRKGLYVFDRTNWLGTKEGSNIDKRNAAMSQVAGLLGKPGLIAEAKPMIVQMGGTSYSGTFMESAPGYDAYDGKADNPMRTMSSQDYNDPDIFDDIAALQAIDYICGNLDRHPGNFKCQFAVEGEKKKLVKIVGIDNDMSFGTSAPESHPNPEKPLGKPFVLPREMCAIGESTARKIEALTKEQLTIALRGYDLSKEELEAAWRRTEILQNAIRDGRTRYKDIPHGKLIKGVLRVVPEADWEKYTLGKLAVERNQFRAIGTLRKAVADQDKIHERQDQERQRTKEAKQLIYGIQEKGKEEIKPVTGVPVGNGIVYTVMNKDPLGVSAPGTLRMVIPENAKPDAVGGAYNRRIALKVKDAEGGSREGFFMAAADIKGREQMRNLIDRYVAEQEEKNPLWAEAIRRSATGLLQDGHNLVGNPDFDLRDIGFSPETAAALKNDPAFFEFYRVFRAQASMVQQGVGVYAGMQANPDGSIEKRNVAMSRLSDALGCSGCIVHAEPMQVETDGRITDGIFMDRAPGKNFQDFRRGDEEVKQGLRAFDGSEALKDLADIQVMDYICMNIDRNENNLMFQYSEDGKKCLHVIGIDNDLSFGAIRVAPEERHNLETALNDIHLISEEQAKRIKEMTEIGFRSAIGDQGLSEAEYSAARERLMNIRNRINQGAIRIVKDDEWKDMTLEQMAEQGTFFDSLRTNLTYGLDHRLTSLEMMEEMGRPEEKKEIHFTEGKMVKEFSAETRTATELYERTKDAKEQYAEQLMERFSRKPITRAYTDQRLMDYMVFFAGVISDEVEGENSILHGKSAYFINLMRASTDFKNLVQRKNEEMEEGTELNEESVNEILESMKAVRTAAHGYTAHVEGVRQQRGSISRTQRNRNAMATELAEYIGSLLPGMHREINRREAENHPDRRLYSEINALQRRLENPGIDIDGVDESLARVIYYSGLSHNVFRLAQEKKLSTAMLSDEVESSVQDILSKPAFRNMVQVKGRGALMEMACRENGEQLFKTFAESMAKDAMKAKMPSAKPAPKQVSGPEANTGREL